MKKIFICSIIIIPPIVLFSAGINNIAYAQPGPSLSINYDFLPYQNFSDPPAGLEDADIWIQRSNTTISYPIVFSEGRTVLVNNISYQYFKANYRNWPETLGGEPTDEPDIDILHAAQYTLMLQRMLSRQWSLWALVTPGLASDLKADISNKDFNFQAATVFIKSFSRRFSLGIGAAYTTQFGEAVLVPILAFDWNNGASLSARGIIPTDLEIWYRHSQRIFVGLQMKVEGNVYHGDPDIYLVDDPRLRYSIMTFGPSAKFYIYRWAHLNITGGVVGLHRFEFFDGDTKASSYDLKPSYYIRAGIQLGG